MKTYASTFVDAATEFSVTALRSTGQPVLHIGYEVELYMPDVETLERLWSAIDPWVFNEKEEK